MTKAQIQSNINFPVVDVIKGFFGGNLENLKFPFS